MSDYTPSLDEVREVYVTHSPEFGDGSGAEFDRMIEAVRAEALREAVAEFEGNVGPDEFWQQSIRPGSPKGWSDAHDAWETQGPFMDWLRNRADRIEREAGE